ncbi:alpha/beta fold hydrolase [Frankia sp. CNm7]|uniref:Alpha/beta fold hydrolase n=1 Tax=Frankia nepalensis TaxID=1836974 RepID=A0A937RFS2_9ACTN|nr:epoxide hydrolase family protein [Frankia nepalensis]MBL7501728.1 alpha/beta fold hydrolase [Frankia nepalensis]MBL7514346.1 alpha/beta fold hydrolase [Frankia nepalensis]MBL7519123.1 alpha/beta fold hydrolase [Frankia nepalensis]MBL7631371.1 alpha/beta fold hydrolase [Frankia nepalensis]
MSTEIAPFKADIPESDLADLRRRLVTARWPEKETVDDWSQGVPLEWLRDLCAYWADGYDWRRCEARLNAFDQFVTTIDGLDIHFLHVRSPNPDALPLLLTHGWPGSVLEFLDVIGPLADPAAHGGEPADAFHLVIPSLPGYGFSGRPTGTGWGVSRTAAAWATLMARLGYDRYAAQGGDWGSAVTTALAAVDREHLVGIHLNFLVVGPGSGADAASFTEEELAALTAGATHLEWGLGYSTQQGTRPQTLGYGLVDSPVGQCAWIAEKFWAWTHHDGDPYTALTRDQMLDDITLYWLTATGASSARMYWETGVGRSGGGAGAFGGEGIDVPAGVSMFPGEIFRPSRRWAEQRLTDLRFYERPERGGHFAAFEQPALFTDQVRRALRTMR